MFDIKTAREEMAKLHNEASQHVEKFSKAEVTATDDESTAQKARFERLEKLAADIDSAEKLAKYAFSKEQTTPTVKAVRDIKHPDHVAFESPAPAPTRETYAQQLSSWVRGDEREDYATITVSGNSAIVPVAVSAPLTPTKYNCYRAAYLKLGYKPESFGNTSPNVIPIITSTSGGLISEGTQDTAYDADPSVASMTLHAHGYQSKTYWYSNEMINAQQWDVTSSTLPALQGAREYGLASAISAAIIADDTITQSVSTASSTTITIDNLDDLIHSFALLYDADKVIFLNMDTYAACEQLKDSNGRPIFEFQTIQDDSFTSYKGVPVFKHDSFQELDSENNVVGCAISLRGFRLRDEMEKLIKYVDSPSFVDQTGLNDVAYHGFAYVPDAVTKLVAG
jgi:HK97 family phage major capsid protein